MTAQLETPQISKARLVPLVWENDQLIPTEEISAVAEATAKPEITVLHTNDFHSSISGRPDHATGQLVGGITRIATTIKNQRAAGPTLVLDAGDSVFGSGTWWDALGATTTARLRGAAGYDLAAIGNHDMEHGLDGLAELFEGNYPFVAANLFFDRPDFQQRVRPAYIAELAGWRIGLVGVTTPSTLELVPSRMLAGMTLTDPLESLNKTIKALEPLVDTIIIISHLGFHGHGEGDLEIAPRLAGSKVSVILGGHTHDALVPAPVVNGIVLCNAGAYGENMSEIKISQAGPDGLVVRAGLIRQDDTVAEDAEVLALRESLAAAFQSLRDVRLALPDLKSLGEDGLNVGYGDWYFNRDRETVLLAQALGKNTEIDPASLLIAPILYVLGSLPKTAREVDLAELAEAYPNIERLVELEIAGNDLKELLEFQNSLLFYAQGLPLWITGQNRVKPAQLENDKIYKVISTELVAEGGLGWLPLPGEIRASRVLPFSCKEAIRQYLEALNLAGIA